MVKTWSIDLRPVGYGERAKMMFEGEDIGTSRQPIYAAARVLLARGFDPYDTLETRRNGVISMSGTIGKLATITVSEPDRGAISTSRFIPNTRFLSVALGEDR